MARIAFFIEEIPPTEDVIATFAWDLIRSLADQQHEIRVFSTYREGGRLPEPHPRIEILRPFKRWNVLELAKLTPLLMQFRPEILHLIQPHKNALTGLTNAMSFIPTLAPLLGGPVTVASFFDLNEKSLPRHRLLLTSADALTVANELQLEVIERALARPGRARRPLVEIVPIPIAAWSHEPGSAEIEVDPAAPDSDIALEGLRTSSENLIVVPGPLDQHFDPVFTLELVARCLLDQPQAQAVLLGGWATVPMRLRHAAERKWHEAGVGSRAALTGPLAEEEETLWIHRATCVLIAPFDETRLSFTRVLRASQRASAALVLSNEQARLDPIAWRDSENALVRPRTKLDLAEAVRRLLRDSELRARLQDNIEEFSRAGVVDHPGNIISRLYVRAASLKHTARQSEKQR
jgi:hypothetical protein